MSGTTMPGYPLARVRELPAALVPLYYVESVDRAGGRALIVPPSAEGMDETLDVLDGIIFSGGIDIDPATVVSRPLLACVPEAVARVHAALRARGVAPGTPLVAVAPGSVWATKRWMPPDRVAQLRASTITVYNNTCSYTGGNGFDDINTCFKFFDEGRIPSTSDPLAPVGASDDNLIDSFEFAYCTNTANGLIDVKVGFYPYAVLCRRSAGERGPAVFQFAIGNSAPGVIIRG